MTTRNGFLEAWEFLYRNTSHKDWSRTEQFDRMTDYFETLQDLTDELLIIGARRIVLSPGREQWFPKIGEWRAAIVEWLGTGMIGAATGEDALEWMHEADRIAASAQREKNARLLERQARHMELVV